ARPLGRALARLRARLPPERGCHGAVDARPVRAGSRSGPGRPGPPGPGRAAFFRPRDFGTAGRASPGDGRSGGPGGPGHIPNHPAAPGLWRGRPGCRRGGRAGAHLGPAARPGTFPGLLSRAGRRGLSRGRPPGRVVYTAPMSARRIPAMPPAPSIRLVVAYTDTRVIGLDGAMPWRLPADLAHFKRSTLGHPIVMGRKTWLSLGRPLPGRRNLVLSRDPGFDAPGAECHASLESALASCAHADLVCVIGGEQV